MASYTYENDRRVLPDRRQGLGNRRVSVFPRRLAGRCADENTDRRKKDKHHSDRRMGDRRSCKAEMYI